MKGAKPPKGIKKEDRLETSLGPIVNNKKLFIKKEMTELVDEFFEHPKPRNDDIMDAIYYANFFAWSSPPRSKAMDVDSFYGKKNSDSDKKGKKRRYNWISGARI